MQQLSYPRLCILMLLMCCTHSAYSAQGIPNLPQIPAFLPMAHTVPATRPTPIDGEWVINSIGKRVRIQSGRAYAIDSWLHMFVLKVQPMMVVIKDIQAVGPGQFRGNDLPLMGTWQAQLAVDGTLNVAVKTMLGSIPYSMMPVRLDDPAAFERAKRGEAAGSGRSRDDHRRDEVDEYGEYEEYEEAYDDEAYGEDYDEEYEEAYGEEEEGI